MAALMKFRAKEVWLVEWSDRLGLTSSRAFTSQEEASRFKAAVERASLASPKGLLFATLSRQAPIAGSPPGGMPLWVVRWMDVSGQRQRRSFDERGEAVGFLKKLMTMGAASPSQEVH